MKNLGLPLIAVIIAVIVTTTMDFTGLTTYSAFPLLLIIIVFWLLNKLSKKEIGLVFGKRKYYGYALLYPLSVLGVAALIAYLYGNVSVDEFNINEALINVVAGSIIGPIVLMLTEEGFFRGWLWGSLKRAGKNPRQTLVITSGLFVLWHISAVTSGSEYGLPMYQVPVYLINAFLLGMIWGTLRWASGSIIVASVSHAVWNVLAYMLFGYGEKVGKLGITETLLLGPEVGFLGIILNGLFLFWLLKITRAERTLSRES